MYMAKRDSTAVALYSEDRDNNSVRNLSMSGELRQAMDDDDLVLHFQPQIDVATESVTGAEVLIRWEHPRYGIVPPVEFIALAEQSGLIGPLTRWVLGRAVKCLGDWQSAGYDIGLSVNLSPRNLHEDDLAGSVARLMLRRGIRPGSLTMEITEDAIMTDPERALQAVRELKESGVRLAIDDFGIGHSSLRYLKTLPVDELKIDKSFVQHVSDGGNDAVIVRSTIDLAHNLGLTVVAEGVESEPHLQSLRGLACDVAQGYHIGRPMPRDVFDHWMRGRLPATPEGSASIHPHPAARRGSASGL
jgi:EAL domain-containing protein (putative c-di-GMP-specific phosphodiesterase class I)